MKKVKMTKKGRALLYAMVSSTLLFQTPVTSYAEETETEYSFDQVVITATRTPMKVSETPANVTVITREEIEKRHYNNIGEILRHTPGVEIRTFGNPGSISAPYIYGSEQVVLMIDGRRMNMPNGIGGFGSATANLTSFISVENIERIEVIKGGRGALYGADAVGGVINIITKQGEQNRSTVKASGGNWNGKSYSFTNEGKQGDLGWFITAENKKLGNYSDGKGNSVDYTGVEQNTYTIRLDQKINDGKLSFIYENLDDDNEGKAINKFDRIRQHNWDITYTSPLSSVTNHQIKVYKNGIHRFSNKADSDVRMKGFNYQINSNLNEKNLLTAGLDWRKDELASSTYGNKDNTTKGWYLQNQWDITDKWTLTPGVRYDQTEAYGDRTSPQIAATYKVDEKTSYFASWGKVFHAPRFDDLYWPHQVSTYGGITYTYDGNPNIKPETGWSVEAGIKHSFDATSEGKVSFFKRSLKDAITWKDIGTDKYNQHWIPSNVDKQKAYGVEVQLSKQLTDRLRSYIAFNYIDAKNKSGNGSFVKDPTVPDKTWNVGLEYADTAMSAGIKGTAVSGREDYKYNKYIAKDYWLWDADLNLKLSKASTFFLTINNIFDTYYDGAAGYPCPGRNYQAGIQYQF